MIGSPNKPLQVNCMKRRTGPQTGPRVLMKKLMKAMVVKSKGRMIQAPLRTSLLVGLEVERGSEPLKYFIVIACAVYAYLHPHLRLGHLILMEHFNHRNLHCVFWAREPAGGGRQVSEFCLVNTSKM